MDRVACGLLIAVSTCLPLSGQEPSLEYCSAPDLAVAGDGTLHTDELEVVEADGIVEMEIFIDIETDLVSQWSEISLQSPAGDSVRLYSGGGSASPNFLAIFSDYGLPNVENYGAYDCGGCVIPPSGPGSLADFSGESTGGQWQLQLAANVDGDLEEWCLRFYALRAVSDLTCAPIGAGTATLSWTNEEAYDEVEIHVDGALEATLSGPFDVGSTGAYTTAAHSTPSLGVIAVTASSAVIGDAPSNRCFHAFTAEPEFDAEVFPKTSPFGLTPAQIASFEPVESFAVADLQIDVQLGYGAIDEISIELSTPQGTSVFLHQNSGGAESAIDATYWTLGVPNGAVRYDCRCPIQASGPGTLEDVLGEQSAPGIWTIVVASVQTDVISIERLALRLYDEGIAHPVLDLSCVDGTSGSGDLTWINGADYDEITIYVDGEVDASLTGPLAFGELTTISTTPQNEPARIEVCVEAEPVTVFDSAVCCELFLCPESIAIAEIAAPIVLVGQSSSTIALNFAEAVTLVDAQCDVAINGAAPSSLAITITSPAGATVVLHDHHGAGGADVLDVTYWDFADPYGTHPFDCACPMQPPDAYGLSEFVGEPVAAGEWTVQIDSSGTETAIVERVELRIYAEGPAYEVRQLLCEQGFDPSTVEMTWINAGAYDEITVHLNGSLYGVLAGPFAAGSPGSFVIAGLQAPSSIVCAVEGVEDGALSPLVSCAADLMFPPVGDLSCSYMIGIDEVLVAWTNPIFYGTVNVYVDGVAVGALPGVATEYLATDLPISGTVEICVEGASVGVGVSLLRCCTVFIVEGGDANACASPWLEVPSALLTTHELTLSDDVFIRDVDVLIDIAAGFVGRWEIIVESPLGTEVQLHDHGGNAADDFLLLFDDDAAARLPLDYDCACAVPSNGSGALLDFFGEPSAGTWVSR